MNSKNQVVLLSVLLGMGTVGAGYVHAAAQPIKKHVGNHYILVKPDMQRLQGPLTRLQQDVHNFLIRQNVLKNVGLSFATNYTYVDANFAQLAPHISLLPVPASIAGADVRAALQGALQNYQQKPTAFNFKSVEAFLPTPGSQKVFIVARTSSNVSYGFFNLSQYFERLLKVQNSQPWFLGHISLGTLTAKQGQGFTQKQVNDLNVELKKFTQLPQGTFPIEGIIFSEFKGKTYPL